MRTSSDHTLTSHVGSLPRPDDLIEANRARQAGERIDEPQFQESCGRLSPTLCGSSDTSASMSPGTANTASRWVSASITAHG